MNRFGAVFWIVLVASLSWPAPPGAFANGIVVWPSGVATPPKFRQEALVLFDRGCEELTLEISVEGPPRPFAWIVPLPSEPDLAQADPCFFAQLDGPNPLMHYGRSRRARGLSEGVPENDCLRAFTSDPIRLEDATTLTTAELGLVRDRLEEEGFQFPPQADRVFAPEQLRVPATEMYGRK